MDASRARAARTQRDSRPGLTNELVSALAPVIGAPALLPRPLVAQHLRNLLLELLARLPVAGIVGRMMAPGACDLLLELSELLVLRVRSVGQLIGAFLQLPVEAGRPPLATHDTAEARIASPA